MLDQRNFCVSYLYIFFIGKKKRNSIYFFEQAEATFQAGEKFAQEYLSADFFDVEHFPFILFKSKQVILTDANHGQLIGDLTIRNITKEVVLDGEYGGVNMTPFHTYSAGFSVRGKVNRKDWGLNWNAVLAGGGLVASDEITLVIDLELTRPVEASATIQNESSLT